MAITEATRTAFSLQASRQHLALSIQPLNILNPSAALRLRGEIGGRP
jgi:hypothetical protein